MGQNNRFGPGGPWSGLGDVRLNKPNEGSGGPKEAKPEAESPDDTPTEKTPTAEDLAAAEAPAAASSDTTATGKTAIAEKLKAAIEAKDKAGAERDEEEPEVAPEPAPEAETEQEPEDNKLETGSEAEDTTPENEPTQSIMDMRLRMREKQGLVLRIAKTMGVDKSKGFKGGYWVRNDQLDGYNAFRNRYVKLRRYLAEMQSNEEQSPEDLRYAESLLEEVERHADRVIEYAKNKGVDLDTLDRSYPEITKDSEIEDIDETDEEPEVDDIVEDDPAPDPEPTPEPAPEPGPTPEPEPSPDDYVPNEFQKSMHEARNAFVTSRERYVNAWHAQDTNPSEDTKREYEETKAAFTDARKARLATIREAATGHAERRSEEALARGVYNVDNGDEFKRLKGEGTVEKLKNLEHRMAGAAVLESAKMRLALEKESLPQEKKGLLGAMQGVFASVAERAKKTGEWMGKHPFYTIGGLALVFGPAILARKAIVGGASKVAGAIGGQEAAIAAAQTAGAFLSAALLGAAAGRISGDLVGRMNQGGRNLDRWWTKRQTRKRFDIDDIENDVRNMYKKEQSSAKGAEFTKKAKRVGTVAGAVAGMAMMPDTIGEDPDILFTPDDVDLGSGYHPDLAEEYNEVINLPDPEPTPEPVLAPELADYTAERGDNFWDIMEGDTNAARPPIMGQIDPAHEQSLIDLTRDHIDAMKPHLREELGFGATADVLATGEEVDMDEINKIATSIAEEQGWIIPEVDTAAALEQPATVEVTPDIANYSSEYGDNFWDIMEGDTNAARPPIMDNIDPAQEQALIDLTRDHINNELSAAERENIGFGATASHLPTGAEVNMEAINDIATQIAEEEGWILQEK